MRQTLTLRYPPVSGPVPLPGHLGSNRASLEPLNLSYAKIAFDERGPGYLAQLAAMPG